MTAGDGARRRKDTTIGAMIRRRDAKRGHAADPAASFNDPGRPEPTGRTSGEKHVARRQEQS